MNETITVDCTISRNGRIWIHRIKPGDTWLIVEQGRQWHDDDGRHVLVMHSSGHVQELLLSSRTLRWEVIAQRSSPQIV